MKCCKTCGVEKEFESFYKHPDKADGRHTECKSCAKVRQSSNRNRAENARRSNLKLSFGLTTEQYDEILMSQKGCCACCGTHHTEFKRALAVDHCHETGSIRGLLCAACNSGIGKLGDNVEGLLRGIAYLQSPDTGYHTPK